MYTNPTFILAIYHNATQSQHHKLSSFVSWFAGSAVSRQDDMRQEYWDAAQ